LLRCCVTAELGDAGIGLPRCISIDDHPDLQSVFDPSTVTCSASIDRETPSIGPMPDRSNTRRTTLDGSTTRNARPDSCSSFRAVASAHRPTESQN
jgi:hypothetical protein